MLRTLLLSITLLLLLTLSLVIRAKAEEIEATQVIGFYTAGCVRNSSELPPDGKGYQVIRLNRKRYYGHPDLIEYIQSTAREIASRLHGVLLIGDLSQKNGGPLPSDHNSHQNGLDADILFWQHPFAMRRTLTSAERERIEPLSLLSRDFSRLDDFRWDPIHGQMLKLAAASERVDRIFVNPVIKGELCKQYQQEEWLRKIRPWWGHDGHFHVRLHCPPGSPLCEPQEPVPLGDGCDGDLNAWFDLKGLGEKKTSKRRTPRHLPSQCLTVLAQ